MFTIYSCIFFIVSICKRAYYLQSPVLLTHIRFQKFAQKSIYNFFMNFAKHFAISVCPATQRANLFPRAHPKPKVKALLISKINTTLKVTI